jgi:succinoglycan biosynthesis protein ExoA
MPSVSIIVPCYNEERRIRILLDAVFAQTYSHENIEIIISDGQSTDRTREVIKAWHMDHPDIALQIVDNLKGSIPAALNRAIEAARGEIILRLDGHSAPYLDYVEKCVSALRSGRGENVGGVWEIRPGADGWIAHAIAAAAAHPLGVGNAMYRHATEAAYVDTVPFGCYRRDLIERLGKYDDTLLTNEDYELNARIRLAGGKIWLDPAIRSVYFSRSTLGALARQYWRYGFWKWRMLRRYPQTLRWRQALPPLFVLGLVMGLLFAWIPILRILWIISILLYIAILLLAGFLLAIRKRRLSLIIGLPLAIGVQHLAWGSGFLWSIFSRSGTSSYGS